MISINNKLRAYEWMERYANFPSWQPTKEEAIRHLKKLGVLNSNGNVVEEYKEIIVPINK